MQTIIRAIKQLSLGHASLVTLILVLVYMHLFAIGFALAVRGATLPAVLVGLAGLLLLLAAITLVATGRPAEEVRVWLGRAVGAAVARERVPDQPCEPENLPAPRPEPVVICEPAEVTLEDNKPFAKLAKENADFMDELDALSPQLDEGARKLVQHVNIRLQEALERCGVGRIEEETIYDVVRHRSASGQRIVQGGPICETVEPGLALGRKVLRRAKVK